MRRTILLLCAAAALLACEEGAGPMPRPSHADSWDRADTLVVLAVGSDTCSHTWVRSPWHWETWRPMYGWDANSLGGWVRLRACSQCLRLEQAQRHYCNGCLRAARLLLRAERAAARGRR